MGLAAVVFAVLVLIFATFAQQLGRWNVTAPIAFVGAGAVLGFTRGAPPPDEVLWLVVFTKVTLALVLFHDAAQVAPRYLRADRAQLARMLGIGFVLTVGLGYLLARWMFPTFPVMLCLLMAAALAPTDASLGAPTILNPAVPARIRRLLNEESGFNDGLAAPIALFAIASLAGSEGLGPGMSALEAFLEIGLGVLVGAAVGLAAGVLLGLSRAAGWSSSETRALAVVTLPVIAFGGAALIGGNGFVAAFVAGTSLVGVGRWTSAEHSSLHLTEVLAGPLAFAIWCLFGLVAVPLIWGNLGWREWVFALLSLTVLRMLPVALALTGTGFRTATVFFVGWFGPRGLVSVLFALMAVESLVLDDSLRQALRAIVLTVALSVVAHGLSAGPLARRYGAWVAAERPAAELAGDEDADYQPHPRGSILARRPESAGTADPDDHG